MKSDKEIVKIIPIGGLGSIGKNMTLFEYEDDIIIVDCGIQFPDETMPGVDFLIPDFSYVMEHKHRVRGIIITHAHEDHVGAIPYLLQSITAPVYATRLTIGLMKSRLEEKPPLAPVTFVEMSPRDSVHINTFVVEFVRTNHSIIDCVGLMIQTPIGAIIHTGDFKIDHSPVDGFVTDIYRLAEYGEKGVLLLMSDSTNAEIQGYTRSEIILNKKLFEIFAAAKGRIFVASFASNINRIQQILDAAQRYNKKVIISGLTMQKNIEIAQSLGYLTCKEDLIVDIKEAKKYPLNKQVVICTGSQGEPMSALTRIANGTHKHFVAGDKDTVIITASIIPGNERMVGNVINSLMRQNADVYYEQNRDLHVSGHASQEELKLMISLTKPKFFMPIHGEFKHLKAHERVAESLKIKAGRIMIADNGDVLALSKKGFEKVDHLRLRDIFIDGNQSDELDSNIIRDRRLMAEDGVVLVTVLLGGVSLRQPVQVLTRGFMLPEQSRLAEHLNLEVEDMLSKFAMDAVPAHEVRILLKKNLRSVVHRLTNRNPLVEIQVIDC